MASTSTGHSHLLGKPSIFPWVPSFPVFNWQFQTFSLFSNFSFHPWSVALKQDLSFYWERERENLYIFLIAKLFLLPFLASHPMAWTPDIWSPQRMCSHTQALSLLFFNTPLPLTAFFLTSTYPGMMMAWIKQKAVSIEKKWQIQGILRRKNYTNFLFNVKWCHKNYIHTYYVCVCVCITLNLYIHMF